MTPILKLLNQRPNRRRFLKNGLRLGLAAAAAPRAGLRLFAASSPPRRMTRDLVCGNLGIAADQREAITLAHRYAFESVGADGGYLARLTDDSARELVADLQAKGLVFGAAGLPVDFRADEDRFQQGLQSLPDFAAGLQRAGVTRVATWIAPTHPTLNYAENLRQHVRRLRPIAAVLRDHAVRLGLEYVATRTARAHARFPFIHDMVGLKDLLARLDAPHVGLVLDSWHWWQADETAADIRTLRGDQVIAVDLNDAPAGVPKDQQLDNRRELPLATGVIDAGAFLNALNRIGYDGPVRAEPFNRALNALGQDAACAATARALKRAFALIA